MSIAWVIDMCAIAFRTIDWGDFPTWFSAITTLLATIAASIAAVYARKAFAAQARAVDIQAQALTVEQERDQDRDSERRMAQAEQVCVWADLDTERSDLISIAVRNASQTAIYNVALRFEIGEPDSPGYCKGKLKPVPVVPPAHTEYVHIDRTNRDALADAGVPARGTKWREARCTITFKDAAGRYWCRQEDGILRRAGDH